MESSGPLAVWWGREAPVPVVAVAVHAGHALRDEVAALMRLPAATRRREEDPGTDQWAACFPTHLVAARSRFEVDLNRPPEGAVYLRPEHCWDLDLWAAPPPDDLVARSRAAYDTFYSALAGVLDRARAEFGRFVVYDLHSYNHRRGGPDRPPGDPRANPDLNVGTGSMDRSRWAPVVDGFVSALRWEELPGMGRLDVRENVRFRGGHLARWVHERYPDTGCALAVEVKKFYMDEYTGTLDASLTAAVGEALAASAEAVADELQHLAV